MIVFQNTIDISKFLLAISSMSGLVDPDITDHNYRVAFLSYLIAREISYSNEFLYNTIVAALLHDIGLLLFHHKEDLYLVKQPNGEEIKRIHLHAELGYELLRNLAPLSKVARIIRYHHYTYPEIIKLKAPFASSIIHLADRLDVFLATRVDFCKPYYENYSKYIFLQKEAKEYLQRIKKYFHPKSVDILIEKILPKEAFWFEYLNSSNIKETLCDLLKNFEVKLPLELFEDMAHVLAYIIDFKSPFTATHSSGVAQTAASLAGLMHFTSPDIKKMKIAGLLHDIGKVAIPLEILEKPGRLNEEEIGVMRSHVYFTYKILKKLNIDPDIIEWASFHHEHLDGNGYPFKLNAKYLSLGSRIMSVADIFTALMEKRPYKKELSTKEALEIIEKMVESKKLCKRVVEVLKNKIDIVDKQRKEAQERARRMYDRLRSVADKFLVKN